MKDKFKNSTFYKNLEKMFSVGSYESFLLHDFLLLSNIGLTILMIVELTLIFGYGKKPSELNFIHWIDLVFGLIFISESILRMIYVYIPNKIYFKPSMVINWIVIISLVWPGLFGNLAFLRIIRSLKIIKIFLYKKEKKVDLGDDDYDGILKIILIAHKSVFGFLWRRVKSIFIK